MNDRIELRHLRYFLKVAEELHFSKAAEKLFISQPGLSKQISQLEEELGFKLLIRDKKQVKLTQTGKYMQREVAEILLQLKQIYSTAKLIDSGCEGLIRIGFVGSAMQKFIPKLIKNMNENYSNIRFSFLELSNYEQLERLQNGRLDIGFVRSMKVHSGLSQKKLLKETFSLILPSDHIIDESNFRDLSQFKNENFILFSSENNYGYYENVISIFDDHGFSPKVSHNTVHANTIYSLVENKLGIAIIPTSLCMFANNNLKFIELKNIKQRTSLSLIWKKENINPILPKIIDTL